MPLPRFFFVYVLLDEVTGLETHVITGDNWTTLVRTRAFVHSGVTVDRLLYLSNVKEGTHAERLARGEVLPQAKSPHRVDEIARVMPRFIPDEYFGISRATESHQFINAGIGLSPDSVCSYCKGLASEHPDMETPLAVMARVHAASTAAPCEDGFQGGAGGESGPHLTEVDIKDFLTDEDRQIRDAC